MYNARSQLTTTGEVGIIYKRFNFIEPDTTQNIADFVSEQMQIKGV